MLRGWEFWERKFCFLHFGRPDFRDRTAIEDTDDCRQKLIQFRSKALLFSFVLLFLFLDLSPRKIKCAELINTHAVRQFGGEQPNPKKAKGKEVGVGKKNRMLVSSGFSPHDRQHAVGKKKRKIVLIRTLPEGAGPRGEGGAGRHHLKWGWGNRKKWVSGF